jgi:hypothetical protein
MEVNIELKPITWSNTQGSLYCDDDWILMYELYEIPYNSGKYNAIFSLLEKSRYRLNEKYKLKSFRDEAMYQEACFENKDEAINACNAHYRELMLKAFLQVV